jgi:PIN domain nuclease of toxin-antitoxin system
VTRLLVDTHVLLWWRAGDPALSSVARSLIADPTNEALVSTASLWEIAIKCSVGKLSVPDDLPETTVERGFAWLPVSPRHAWEVRGLPYHHRDPFDRLLVAQARVEAMPVVTSDRRFAAYGVDVRW